MTGGKRCHQHVLRNALGGIAPEGGRDGKGMVAWKATIKPSDIQKVASYVLSLQGTNPKDPKPTEPEAKEWKEDGAAAPAATAVTDSTKVAAK